MKKRNKYILGTLAFTLLVSLFGLLNVSGTDGLKGSVYSAKATNVGTLTVFVDGEKLREVKVANFDKTFKSSVFSIDKKFKTTLSSSKGSLIPEISDLISSGTMPSFGKDVAVVGVVERQLMPTNEDFFGSKEGSVQNIDRNDYVSSKDQAPNPADFEDKQSYMDALKDYQDSTSDSSDSSTSPGRFQEEVYFRGENPNNQNSGSSNTDGSRGTRFTREIAPRYEDPTSDRGYGSPTSEDELSVTVFTKNGALGVGTNVKPTNLDGIDGANDQDYGTSNPGVYGDDAVNPSSIDAVNITLDCARSMSDVYCGKNSNQKFEIIFISNPRSGGMPQA